MSANRLRATETVRDWNQNFPIGTEVVFDGKPHKTWSHAGLGPRDETVVWLDGIEEPVPLSRVDVPGWDVVFGRKKSKQKLNKSG